jgi:hypothetical protein
MRWIDGRDGTYGNGLAWDLGHTAFLVAFLLFGVLAVGLRSVRPNALATAAVVATLLGVAAFEWVIIGDLFPAFDDAVPVPDPVTLAGPLMFQVGLLTLLVRLATTRPRRVPIWTPMLLLVGFVLLAVNLDLLPVAAILILAGLVPLATLPRQ